MEYFYREISEARAKEVKRQRGPKTEVGGHQGPTCISPSDYCHGLFRHTLNDIIFVWFGIFFWGGGADAAYGSFPAKG